MIILKTAIVGSQGLKQVDIENYLPPETTEIISGGARGVDSCAAEKLWVEGEILTGF